MGLFRTSKKKDTLEKDEVPDDHYEEDPWYSMNVEEKKRKKKTEHRDDSWDGMGFR